MRMIKHSISFLIAALILTACGSDEKKEQTTQGGTITSMSEIMNASDRLALVGRQVEVSDAVVQQVAGNYVFWSGESHMGVPVARLDKMRGPVTEHVTRGDRVRISGAVRLLETLSATDPVWDMISEREKQEMLAAKVYIAAENVLIVH